jgi:hypothetical protein
MLADQAKSLFISKFGARFAFMNNITNSYQKHIPRASYSFAWGKARRLYWHVFLLMVLRRFSPQLNYFPIHH